MSEGAPVGTTTDQDRKNRMVAGAAVAAVIAVAVVALLTGVIGGSDPTETDARRACEGFVDSRLKAPATADYNLSATTTGESWTVTGVVDSENGFGANIRSDVTCVLHFDGDAARLDSISVE